MSRHRNVRNYAYEDDMSEDVYGHSVEDHDMCVSPSTAHQFMYNRGNDEQKHNLFSNYMDSRFGSVEEEEEDQQSEEEDHLSHSHDYKRPQLDPISQAKLSSCLDQLQSILGDDCHEPTAVDAIIKYNFDAEKALDYLFNKESNKVSKSKPAKGADSISCFSMSDKDKTASNTPFDMSLNSLQHSKPSQNCINIKDNPTNSLMAMSLNSIVEEDKSSVTPTQESSLFSLSPVLSQSPLLATSLKDLAGGMSFSTRESPGLSESPLLATSLKDLAGGMSSIGFRSSTKGNLPESNIFTTSLSSLANQNVSKSTTLIPSATSLAMLVGQAPPQSSTMCSGLSEGTLLATSLSSLANQDVSKSTTLVPTATSLETLAKHSSENTILSTSLSSLANQNVSKGPAFIPSITSVEMIAKPSPSVSALTGEDINQHLLETSLSSLSIHEGSIPVLQQSTEDVLKPLKSEVRKVSETTSIIGGLPASLSREMHVCDKNAKHKDAQLLGKPRHTKSSLKKQTRNKILMSRYSKIHQRSLGTTNPSMFALALCYSLKRKQNVFPESLKSKKLCTISSYYEHRNIVPFNFLTPSPDDVILKKQKQGFVDSH